LILSDSISELRPQVFGLEKPTMMGNWTNFTWMDEWLYR